MPEPFDYTSQLKDVPSPQAAFMSGFMNADQIDQVRKKNEAEKRALDLQMQMQSDLGSVYQKPTIQGISGLMVKYPQIADKFKPALESMNEQQKSARIQQANNIFMPLLHGDRETAIQQMKTQVEAAKNSGDKQTASSLEMMQKLVESTETGKAGDNLVIASVGSFLAAAMGEKEFAKTYEAIGKEFRATAEAPAKLSKAEADALISKNQAKYGENKQTLNTSSGIYERQDDGSWKNTGLMPFAQPQVQVSLNQGQKGFENETTLRKEFNTEAKPFNEVAASFSRLNSASKDDSGASDIAMIYSYMKMLDPGSVVREGEFATAENAGGVGEKIRNLYNKAIDGTRLTPKVRADYLSVAKRLNNESMVKFNKLKRRYKGISERAGLNPENTVTIEDPEIPNGASGAASVDELMSLLGKK